MGLKGKPAKSTQRQTPPLRPAGHDWAKLMYQHIMPVLMQSNMPSFPGFTFNGQPWGAGYPTPTPNNMGQARGGVQQPWRPQQQMPWGGGRPRQANPSGGGPLAY